MVGSDTALKAFEPFPVSENRQIFIEQRSASFFDDCADLFALVRFCEANPGSQHLADSLVATGPAEDKEDGWQQIAVAEHANHVGAVKPETLAASTLRVIASDVLHLSRTQGTTAVSSHLH